MGRTVTAKYRMEMPGATAMSWFNKEKGKPTAANLEKYIHAYAKSLEPGGANEHVSEHFGYIPYPRWARIVEQSSGAVVAEWKAGTFQVW